MGVNKISLGFLLFFITSLCVAQNTRNPESKKSNQTQYRSFKKEKRGFLGFLKKEPKSELKTAEEESKVFRARVSQAYKENAKAEIKVEKRKRKEAKKGKEFFGHKRPPKKRPPGKQKFCDICKIKH